MTNIANAIAFVPFEDAADTELPPVVQASLERHRANLASLVTALRAVGLDDATVQAQLGVVIESYRSELCAAMEQLGKRG